MLSYGQLRKSLNKNFLNGIISPILDGIKLIFKEKINNKKRVQILFLISPFFLFCLILFFIFLLQDFFNLINIKFLFFFLLLIFGLNVYSVIFIGIFSFNKYSIIAYIRRAAQGISYEIVLSLIIILFFFLDREMNKENNFFLNFLSRILFLNSFFIILLIETSRTPFDFSERESELISGFNIEYSSSLFVFLFLGEYGVIIICSYLISLFFFISSFFFFILFLFFFLIIRASLPRFRYDILINFLWKDFLINFIFFF